MNLFETKPDYDAMRNRPLTFAEAMAIQRLSADERRCVPYAVQVAAGRRLIEELAVPPSEAEFHKFA